MGIPDERPDPWPPGRAPCSWTSMPRSWRSRLRAAHVHHVHPNDMGYAIKASSGSEPSPDLGNAPAVWAWLGSSEEWTGAPASGAPASQRAGPWAIEDVADSGPNAGLLRREGEVRVRRSTLLNGDAAADATACAVARRIRPADRSSPPRSPGRGCQNRGSASSVSITGAARGVSSCRSQQKEASTKRLLDDPKAQLGRGLARATVLHELSPIIRPRPLFFSGHSWRRTLQHARIRCSPPGRVVDQAALSGKA